MAGNPLKLKKCKEIRFNLGQWKKKPLNLRKLREKNVKFQYIAKSLIALNFGKCRKIFLKSLRIIVKFDKIGKPFELKRN